jgi:hypothetical protein
MIFTPTTKAQLVRRIQDGDIEDISTWDVSNIEDMSNLFKNSRVIPDISKWKVHNVQNMSGMFMHAHRFNADLKCWKPLKVVDMSWMFGWSAFAGDISQWNVSTVENMTDMFRETSKFNGDLSLWNVGRVTSMSGMFEGAKRFNRDINNWSVGEVTRMDGMFSSAKMFDKPLNKWRTDKVTDMCEMFSGGVFNKPLAEWAPHIAQVINMNEMFDNSKRFNQDLSSWVISEETDINFFRGPVLRDEYLPIRVLITPDEEYEEIPLRIEATGEMSHAAAVNPRQGYAMQVHNVYKSLNKEKIAEIISPTREIIPYEGPNFKDHIVGWLSGLIESVPDRTEKGFPDRVILAKKFAAVSSYFSDPGLNDFQDLLNTVMIYVDSQPSEFKTQYIDLLMSDVSEGYIDKTGKCSTSCVRGVFERIVTSIGSAAAALRDDDRYDELIKATTPLNETMLQGYAISCTKELSLPDDMPPAEKTALVEKCMRRKMEASGHMENGEPELFTKYIQDKLPHVFGGKRPNKKRTKRTNKKRTKRLKRIKNKSRSR